QGVLVSGLGTFAVVQDQFHGTQEIYEVRRPVFQLDMDEFFVEDVAFPTVVIPDSVTIKPLNFSWLSRATSFPRHVVEGCVQETILLYSFHLRNKERLDFIFKDIGVLSCKNDVLCMRFFYECVVGLESKASCLALLHT
ncbi:CCD81 protein, partial [Todus mexicanus]|nr:CCD81 protein [Todus mexicanus]